MTDLEAARADFFRSHRNAELIYRHGMRIISGKIPAQVRRELMEAVKAGYIGRLAKDGLKPEIFFDPRHTAQARIRQADEAVYSASCIAKVVA